MTVGSLERAFRKTVRALAPGDEVAAAVEAGRLICRHIDEALEDPEQVGTKALYLVPHVINILGFLGAGVDDGKKRRAGAGSAGVVSMEAFRSAVAAAERVKAGGGDG